MTKSPDVRRRTMSFIGFNLGRELMTRHIKDLSDLLAIFLEAECKVEVDQLQFDRRLVL